MPDLPVMLRIADRRCVVVGAGTVARRRAAALLEAGARVCVIAPRITRQMAALPVELHQRAYADGDLQGAFLVVAATDEPAVNEKVARDAAAVGALVNRADLPEAGDLTVPAHARHGPITLAVHTGGASATAAAAIRRQLSAALGGDWPAVLETLAPYRQRIQAAFPPGPERLARLAALAGPAAMQAYRDGGATNLTAFCDDLLRSDRPPPGETAGAQDGEE